MRIAILSDVHSNLEALEAVVRQIKGAMVDSVVHLGDVTGYNADPEACVSLMMDVSPNGVLGNHDAVACGNSDAVWFNHVARTAAFFSRESLSADSKMYLKTLPNGTVLSPELFPDGLFLTHGSPTDPNGYIDTRERAHLEIATLQRRGIGLAFVGHTHAPALFVGFGNGNLQCLRGQGRVLLPEGRTCIVNVGSVGQPRDGDPRACFVLFDAYAREVEWVRVEYDVAKCQRRILASGLPDILAQRLAFGH